VKKWLFDVSVMFHPMFRSIQCFSSPMFCGEQAKEEKENSLFLSFIV
jgi:hypothetical protein